MKMRGVIYTFIFLAISSIMALAQELPLTDEAVQETVVDFLKLRNPFLPQLPKEEIIKTPVEVPRQTIDNNIHMNPPAVVNFAPKEQFVPVVLPQMSLQGIVFGVRDPQVIIDDQSYGIGDSVMGAIVKSIGRDGVKLLFGGKEFHVDLQD